MATGRTVPQKMLDWAEAYDPIERTLNPPFYKEMLDATMKVTAPDGTPYPATIALARLISANARAAAIVAALVTQTGVKPIDVGEAVNGDEA